MPQPVTMVIEPTAPAGCATGGAKIICGNVKCFTQSRSAYYR
jgi:hypothetical protein